MSNQTIVHKLYGFPVTSEGPRHVLEIDGVSGEFATLATAGKIAKVVATVGGIDGKERKAAWLMIREVLDDSGRVQPDVAQSEPDGGVPPNDGNAVERASASAEDDPGSCC